MDELTVVMHARDFVRRAGIDSIPIDLEKYLREAGAKLQVRTDMPDDRAGQTIPLPNHHLICVNGNHSEERQRFTVLHEIAHIVLKLQSNYGETLDVGTLNRYSRRPIEEILCDVFAAECLLPYDFFKADVVGSDIGLNALRDLNERYQASLTSTASRYAAISQDACAMVLAENGLVRYVSRSPRMRELGFWFDYGLPAPKGSVIERLISNNLQTDYDELPAYIWTNKDALMNLLICEDACLLGRWEQAISLLWFDDALQADIDPKYSSTNVEDELLPELDGVLPWPSRRHRR